MTQTPIDAAYAAMCAAPDDDAARLRFHERLADAELFLLLDSAPVGDQISPRLFQVEGGAVALAFDREERLADFAGEVAYVAMSGRALAGMMAGQSVGLGLNFNAPSETLIPAETLDWLTRTLGNTPAEIEAKPQELHPPANLPEALLPSLDAKLAMAGGLARMAYLSGVTYEGGRTGHLLGFVDVVPGAEDSLAALVGEALTFSAIDAGELDVGFFAPSHPICAQLAKVALRFDLPKPQVPDGPAAPGTDPDKPPRLR
ncbi:SseB family protein [Aliiroseovarius sp. PTFE2010]|uniref:SseB family protein n=1 Tax=Aliiroseovarius sp. PTFE2010 TaxID=3417190 RepID=UPI003CEE0A54